ncbi:MAG: hypothetical protein ACYC4R_17860 [Anaerolineae bacterium]
MRDPRFWRELLIRGGMMLIIAGITYFFLDAGPWVWLIPVAVAALVAFKWLVRPRDAVQDVEEEEVDEERELP